MWWWEGKWWMESLANRPWSSLLHKFMRMSECCWEMLIFGKGVHALVRGCLHYPAGLEIAGRLGWETSRRNTSMLAVMVGDTSLAGHSKVPFPRIQSRSLWSLKLYVFVDASESVFAAASYFRVVNNGRIRCCLVNTKPKVAPLQSILKPRLNLQAATIGTWLMKTVV